MSPELSVVIAAYNAQHTLGQQLWALQAQTTSFAWEVLVCDNGSTDGTAEVVRQVQRYMPHLHLIDASGRRGPSVARNSGVRHARGPVVAFCDADDRVTDGWLEAMHDALQASELVAGSTEGDSLNQQTTSVSWTPGGLHIKPYLPYLPATGAHNLGIHKSVFEEVGGFHEAMRTIQDTDLCWRVQLAGYRLEHHPEVRIHIRKRDGLRATFRQAYLGGRGDRQLHYRYLPVIAAYAASRHTKPASAAVPPPETTGPPATPGLIVSTRRRVISKMRRTRRVGDLADQAWRVGHWLGRRRGPFDRGIDQVKAPEVLPRPEIVW